MLDFARIKEIKMTDVLLRYKVPLRFKGDYAAAVCPLPSHKPGDTAKSFSINLAGNYWRCFSESCNANNGGKRGGDTINFVALMESCSQLDAAKKLASWYGITQTIPNAKAPAHMEKGPEEKPKTIMQSSNQNCTASSESVKSDTKYMAEVDAWFDELFKRGDGEVDVDYWKRTRNGVKKRLIESYRAGKKVA